MFKKKPNIKNLAPLRSSDRRKTTDQIISDYGIEVPKAESSGVQDEGSTQSSITALRSSLLPEGALSAKFSTTVGADLKTVNGTVYAGIHSGDDLRILWIRLENRLIPTVYTLWRHPKLIPLLHTPGVVVEKMRGGSPLMTPGLARGPPFPEGAKEGALVAIASYENPSVPLVVGECEIDVSALSEVRGVKGHAVRGIHWDGDEVWDWSQNGRQGEQSPRHLEGWFDTPGTDVGEGMADLNVEDGDDDPEQGGVAIDNENVRNNFVEGEDVRSYEEVGRKEMTTQEIDDAFRDAFIYSLYEAKRNHRSEPSHGIDFPIPQSQLISNHVMPYLPIHTPEDAAQLLIKKTSWKNVKKFIKYLDKRLLVKSKDRNGGETVVLDVDFNDRAIAEFTPYRLPRRVTTTTDSAANGASTSVGADSSVGQKLKIILLYKPKDKLTPIFESAQADTRSLYQAGEIRSVVSDYLKNENLQTAGAKMVSINPVLANAVFDSNTGLDHDIIAHGRTPHDALFKRILDSHCNLYHVLLRNDESRDNLKVKAGLPAKIKLVLETRSGNKTATRVSGLEAFHIQPTMLAEELQKACASSTSVNHLVGSSPKNALMEIMVQGPQKDAITKALEKRGVRKDWIELIDKTKKKKGSG